jgi:hypothetical protein
VPAIPPSNTGDSLDINQPAPGASRDLALWVESAVEGPPLIWQSLRLQTEVGGRSLASFYSHSTEASYARLIVVQNHSNTITVDERGSRGLARHCGWFVSS